MKKYKLLKDLPTIKAGAIYREKTTPSGSEILEITNSVIHHAVEKKFINNFDEWFEEIDEDEVFRIRPTDKEFRDFIAYQKKGMVKNKRPGQKT